MFMLNTFKLLHMQKMTVMFALLDLPGKWGINLPQILFMGYLPEKVEQSPIGVFIWCMEIKISTLMDQGWRRQWGSSAVLSSLQLPELNSMWASDSSLSKISIHSFVWLSTHFVDDAVLVVTEEPFDYNCSSSSAVSIQGTIADRQDPSPTSCSTWAKIVGLLLVPNQRWHEREHEAPPSGLQNAGASASVPYENQATKLVSVLILAWIHGLSRRYQWTWGMRYRLGRRTFRSIGWVISRTCEALPVDMQYREQSGSSHGGGKQREDLWSMSPPKGREKIVAPSRVAT
ncbi:uncharacterized protein EDB93DRAFT_1104457 [Suillus bovinus]|uniref:uncharacterized protein n=1 Tax=Suillus bovinus TaxID=48563 RepID=UPI001B863DCE|nr:uncharacterized protein EDB93DRAFT_1104457 [Suillus bovinus]KAG2146058.1 hypothetical protein EDB93DRAFT_1104457 [Suillus bovinus]